MLLVVSATLAAGPEHLAFRAGLEAGVGIGFDALGLRGEVAYGPVALTLAWSPIAVTSAQNYLGEFTASAYQVSWWSNGAVSLAYLWDGDHGLKLSGSMMWSASQSTAPLYDVRPPQYTLFLSPTVGWRWTWGKLFAEASVGPLFNYSRYIWVDDDGPGTHQGWAVGLGTAPTGLPAIIIPNVELGIGYSW